LNLRIEPGQPGFDCAQAGVGVRRGFASRLKVLVEDSERLRNMRGTILTRGMTMAKTMMAKLKIR